MKYSSQEPQLADASPEITRAAALRARELFAENLCALSKLADRMFAWPTGLELLTAIVFANTPTQYIGDNARLLKDAFEDFTSLLTRYDQLLKLSEAQEIPREVVEQLASEIRATDTDYLLREIPNAIQQSIEGVERVSTLVAAMKEFSHPGTKEKTPLNLNKSIESTITVARNE